MEILILIVSLQQIKVFLFCHEITTYVCETFIALWCNGSTTVFGSVRAGSNPARVTNAISFKLLAKINGYRILNDV